MVMMIMVMMMTVKNDYDDDGDGDDDDVDDDDEEDDDDGDVGDVGNDDDDHDDDDEDDDDDGMRSRNSLQHFTRATFYGKFTGKMQRPRLSPERRHTHTLTHFVRAGAVEMHFNMSQEPLHTEIYR